MNKPMGHNIQDYRVDIDGLRAVAVLAVVAFHMAPKVLTGGFVGVDVFFVISGYLISLIIFKKSADNTFTVKDFYIRRTKRIFPTLIMVLISTWVMGYCFLLKDEFRNLGKHIYSGAFFFSNITLWKEAGYFDVASEMKPLLHLWSLSIEEQFYIFWPLIAVLAVRKRWNVSRLLLAIIIFSLILNLILVQTHLSSTFFLLHTRAWELLAGAFLGWMEFNQSSRGFNNLSKQERDFTSVAGFILVVVPYFVYSGETIFPGWKAILPVLGTFILIGSGPSALVNNQLLSARPLVWVGLISYPLYLWHWPLLSYARILDSGESAWQVRFIIVAFAFILSWFTYKFVEQPIRLSIPKQKEGRFSILIVLALFAVGFLGVLTKNQKSWNILSGSEQEELFRVPPFSSRDCTKRFPVGTDSYCSLSGESPSVAVLGDSFSLALRPGLEEYYNRKKLSLVHMGRGSCPPILGVKVKTKGESEVCSRVTETAFERILKIPTIKDVILVARWSAYLDVNQLDLFEDQKSTDRKEVLQNGLIRTIQVLKAAGKKVIFIHAVPDLSFDPKSCLIMRKFQISPHNSSCSVPLGLIRAQQKDYRDVLSNVADLKTFDPMSVLCLGSECQGKIGDVLMYRDKTHLSIQGAKKLSESFDF
jgi:peptidoglycan/LPS O-acetylase OafA/YrhL